MRALDQNDQQVVQEVTLHHSDGLHTRPVMKFVDLAQRFSSTINVTSLANEDETVDGKSAMEMMMLGATAGTKLRIAAQGSDASEAAAALVRLIEDDFGMGS